MLFDSKDSFLNFDPVKKMKVQAYTKYDLGATNTHG